MFNFKKYYEKAKQVLGIVAIVYPIVQAVLATKGVVLPDLGDWTTTSQVGGTLMLAQSEKVVKKS